MPSKKCLFLIALVIPVISYADIPSIDMILPAQAEVGTRVTITGSNFSQDKQNYIRFNKAILGPFESDQGSRIYFTVPEKALGGCNDPGYHRLHCFAVFTQPTMPGNYDIIVVTPEGESNSGVLEIE